MGSEKSEEELRAMHWRDRYDYNAKRQEEALAVLSEEELIERIRANQPDPYHTIWLVIARKGTAKRSARPLWYYLQRNPGEANELHRYHCAAALFNILGMPDPEVENPLRRRVQWDVAGEAARQEALLELRALIDELLR